MYHAAQIGFFSFPIEMTTNIIKEEVYKANENYPVEGKTVINDRPVQIEVK